MTLPDFYNKRFFLRNYGNLSHAEIDDLYLYELDIEFVMTKQAFQLQYENRGV